MKGLRDTLRGKDAQILSSVKQFGRTVDRYANLPDCPPSQVSVQSA